ncbi:aminotransferase class V-fold PLP-dependent enzyme [Natronospirillum operosum]|uniref:Aminotransferase class V-fold PLP-dependent enzyme n=1 Tax=Natronospirillum operosum TaxID=2759953 RepID=A0A4Z0WFZ0_9GAMM|nr:aminotransferase class V-fold PLP-dependent enzyme [Natronospirillum operosum]TGG94867.1 aminotransferase class V-fold PLP-dependent enzyme [Natronospirillum operosum]
MSDYDYAWYAKHSFTPLINVSGTMTGLGASIITQSAIAEATAEAMQHFVSMHEAQARASELIAQLTQAEAGCLTASASAGISLSVAGCMTGLNPGKVEALPAADGMKNEVIVQAGHLCGYGAPIAQAITLAGAEVKSVGQSTSCCDYQISSAISENTVAALYVVSHHVVHYGQCPLSRFVELCHARDIPVIVDAASEYDLTGFLAAGADIVIYSGHKFLGGPTAGIIAGRKDLVKAAYLQNLGIGRGMKIGKESIMGAMAAMQAWLQRDHKAVLQHEYQCLELWQNALADAPGIRASIVPDPTGNPLYRLQVDIDSDTTGWTAAQAVTALAADEPKIIVRDHEIEHGYFQLDPCNLQPGQEKEVSQRLVKTLKSDAPSRHPAADARNGSVNGYLSWLT